jgi:aryl-alcohol dehydrogenase-like predicted oxidoreductase
MPRNRGLLRFLGLTELQKEGKIRAFGVSNFSAEQLDECLKWGRIESDQPRYSALDRGIEAEILPFCRENNVGILAYCPLEQGLLTGKVPLDRVFNEGDQRREKPLFSRENRITINAMLDDLRSVAEKYDATFGQLFLAWLTAQEGVTTALAGTRNEAQVSENAMAGDIVLSDADLAEIRNRVESLSLKR